MFNPQILHFNSLPSTNLEAARRAAEGAAEGLSVVASEQTAGRGRRQRQWASPLGAGLYFSVILRPQFEQSLWPLLTLMAALAAHDALLAAFSLETDIKWPNDILVNEKKLCGILAETVDTPSGRAVVVGIGINLTQNAFPPELETIATSVEAVTGASPELANLLAALVRELATHYDVLNGPGGNAEIIREWCMRSSYCEGKMIRVTDGGETVVGTTRGLERDGALRVETDDGEIRVLRAGDVSSVRPH
ncbi:MAG TPA: biotin--[acetyl-CoA-carboxylase] ligase [Blastocatellia bacterium]|nr:biotin--[acetyl-CoA-carboxylase] ligase [Blastocatellia bacterium]